MNDYIIITLAMAAVMLMTALFFWFLLKGFLIQFLRVKASRGAKILIKLRNPIRDHYIVGWFEEGCLCFKDKKNKVTKRLSISEDSIPFYDCLGVTCVDIDEEKNMFGLYNFKVHPAYDAVKFSDLLTRCLMRPALSGGRELIMLIIACATLFVVIGCAYLCYVMFKNDQVMIAQLSTIQTMLADAAKESVVQGTTQVI